MNASDAGLPLSPVGEDETEQLVLDAPRVVLVIGAAGSLGRTLCAAWADRYDLIRLDNRFDPRDPELVLADLSIWDESWTAHFDEADTVVLLASHSHPTANWDARAGFEFNVMTNLLLAAAQAGIDRVVFACGQPTAGETEPPDLVDCLGERLGQSFVAAFGLSFVSVRIESNAETSDPKLTRLFTTAIETELAEGSFEVLTKPFAESS